jgi:hypothetical protein
LMRNFSSLRWYPGIPHASTMRLYWAECFFCYALTCSAVPLSRARPPGVGDRTRSKGWPNGRGGMHRGQSSIRPPRFPRRLWGRHFWGEPPAMSHRGAWDQSWYGLSLLAFPSLGRERKQTGRRGMSQTGLCVCGSKVGRPWMMDELGLTSVMDQSAWTSAVCIMHPSPPRCSPLVGRDTCPSPDLGWLSARQRYENMPSAVCVAG